VHISRPIQPLLSRPSRVLKPVVFAAVTEHLEVRVVVKLDFPLLLVGHCVQVEVKVVVKLDFPLLLIGRCVQVEVGVVV
jgi:hypothetical protein